MTIIFTKIPINDDTLQLCSKSLLNNQLICIPTDTVYGLAGVATSDEAVKKIFAIKNRPTYNPLIAHFYDVDHIGEYCHLNDTEKKICDIFMPGPLSLILDKKPNSNLSKLCSNNNTQAVRIPNHHKTLSLIKMCNKPLVAPSANISNGLTTTSPWQIEESFKNNPIDEQIYILDDNETKLGIESCVIKVIDNKINILRHGSFNTNDFLQHGFEITTNYGVEENNILSPGMLSKHYSPNAKLRLNATNIIDGDHALLAFGDIHFHIPNHIKVKNLSPNGIISEASHNLFNFLWELDKNNIKQIAVMPIPNYGVGIAINDRLYRACAI